MLGDTPDAEMIWAGEYYSAYVMGIRENCMDCSIPLHDCRLAWFKCTNILVAVRKRHGLVSHCERLSHYMHLFEGAI